MLDTILSTKKKFKTQIAQETLEKRAKNGTIFNGL